MRDHALKNEAGKLEDGVERLLACIVSAHDSAENAEAVGHAEFYSNVENYLVTAKESLVSAYTLLLNGDASLGVEPLDDE